MKTDHVIDVIGRRIVSGQYKEGEVLPSEAKLCDEFNLSRSVIREAMRTLASKKLIENRPYKGTTVSSDEHWNYLDRDVLNWALMRTDNSYLLISLIETRSVFETVITRWAAKRATSHDLAKIESAFKKMQANTDDYDTFYAADLNFHQAILASTHNLILQQLDSALCSLQKACFSSTWNNIKHKKDETLEAHEKLLNAIRLQNEDMAVEATMRLAGLMAANINGNILALLSDLP